MELLIIAVAVFLNIAFIKWKFDKQRYADVSVDLVLLIGVMWLFSGSFGALVVGTIASALVSIFLYFSPPKVSL